MTMPKMPKHRETVCVSTIHPSEVSAYFFDSMVEMMWWDFDNDRQIVERLSLVSGPRIASARNEVVRNFLGYRKAEWLVMVDADMCWAPDTIHRLIASARREQAKIVGALCYGSTATGVMNPTLFRLVEDDKGIKFDRYDEPPPKGMLKVDATGTGFILIHRDVLMEMGEAFYEHTAWPWFEERTLRYDGRLAEVGEDVGFAMKARALGIDVWVDSEVEVLHAKVRLLGSRAYRQFRKELKSGLTSEQRQAELLPFGNPIPKKKG